MRTGSQVRSVQAAFDFKKTEDTPVMCEEDRRLHKFADDHDKDG